MAFVSVIKRKRQHRKVLEKLTGTFTPYGNGYVRVYFSIGMRGDFNSADVELDEKNGIIRARFSNDCQAQIYSNKFIHLSGVELYNLVVTKGIKKINFEKGADGWFYSKV